MAAKKPINPWPEVLKALREATALSQGQLADEIGVSRRQWIRWEHGTLPIGPSLYALRCMVKTHAPSLLPKISE